MCVAADLLHFNERQALMSRCSAPVDLPLAGADHRVRRPNSIVQLALAGVAGFTVSHMAADPRPSSLRFGPAGRGRGGDAGGAAHGRSALRVRGVSLAVVTLAAAVAIEQFGFVDYRAGVGARPASAVPSPHVFGFNLGFDASVRGLDDRSRVRCFSFFTLGDASCCSACWLPGCAGEPRPADAGRTGTRGRQRRPGST